MTGRSAKQRQLTRLLILAAAALPSAGCEQQIREFEAAQKRKEYEKVRDDVVDISQYSPMVPWMWDEEAGGVVGIKTRVYLLSAETGRGTFVSGSFTVHLDVLTPKPDGSYLRQTAHSWTFDEREAYGFRVVEPSIMGASYGLILNWPRGVVVDGRQVQLTFEYERSDGVRVMRRGSRFRVPLPVREATPPTAVEPTPRLPRNERVPSAPAPRK